ncbi:hypothetical protein [Borrelia sp. P9F1]|uniref:hypothetical protein n=1 Tax=Borrelia sp. P9F1 TaxID=3058374 RepID=UPI0026480426|nr:hypothetical protein [Borrelia sp. P9F1]WKC58719.1 hypothetical protein QYZ68_05810 [Borrelia sp. P9F1]
MIFIISIIRSVLLSALLIICSVSLFSLNGSGVTKEEVRASKWKINFKNLKYLDGFFLTSIDAFKALSEEDLLHKLRLCLMVAENKKSAPVGSQKNLLRKSHKFLIKLRDKNPDKAAYLLYELDSLSLLLSDTIELANMLRQEDSEGVQKHYHEYKESLERRLPLIPEYVKEFASIVSTLDHNRVEKSFKKFIPKFADLYNSVKNVHSKLHKHYTQYVMKY